MNLTGVEETEANLSAQIPTELVALKDKIQGQPAGVRETLEPLINEAMEHALFRSRVISIARDALQQFRVELATVKLDLEATKRERATESH